MGVVWLAKFVFILHPMGFCLERPRPTHTANGIIKSSKRRGTEGTINHTYIDTHTYEHMHRNTQGDEGEESGRRSVHGKQ
jgi:hypothetical protein